DVDSQLSRDFPDGVFVLNGGLADAAQSVRAAADFDGGMLGRAACHTPRVLSEVSLQLWPSVRLPGDAQVVDAMMEYAARQVAQGVPLRVMTRPMLGLVNGQSGARRIPSSHRPPGHRRAGAPTATIAATLPTAPAACATPRGPA
ncbi:tRNA-dihydrouridine synthase, partial [Achromobacter xylosoxidans]